ncbi:hypothetical protein ElyMa_004089200 [Elysia marginata]|uniref:Uncharacterized protein n=1 Tax=Elysia marginata TaxID=1093978 RepID=A0AAV4GAT7_9GAST|nr:hypothetical protein ElyMa_004089200 [Elysia marginata]
MYKNRRRPNSGHSLEVLPDIHPFEADDIAAKVEAYAGCMRLGSLRDGSFPCIREEKGPWDTEERTTARPAIFYQDGRPYNRLAVDLFKKDPCKYYWNTYPWCPERPRLVIPNSVAYKGLGKPPKGVYFKLTPKRVASGLTLPSYEILRTEDPDAFCHYFKHSV